MEWKNRDIDKCTCFSLNHAADKILAWLHYFRHSPNPVEVTRSFSSSFQRRLMQVYRLLPPWPTSDSCAMPTSITAPKSMWKPPAELIILGRFLLAYRTKRRPPLSSLWASDGLPLLCVTPSVTRYFQISSLHFLRSCAHWEMGKEGWKATLPRGNLRPCHCKTASGCTHGSACPNTAWHFFEALGCELTYISVPGNMENGVQLLILPLGSLPNPSASHASTGARRASLVR